MKVLSSAVSRGVIRWGIIVYKTFFGKSTGLFRRTLYFPIFSMWKTDRSAMGYGKGKVEMLILILLRAILLVGW